MTARSPAGPKISGPVHPVALPVAFLARPVAHRALHDRDAGRPENSRSAIRAAIEAGYGIEIDVQMTSDGEAMVFHDYDLARLTGQAGVIRQRSAAEAGRIALSGGDGETIPTLAEVLELVAGRVPLLVEVKDQDGALGPDGGELDHAVARAIQGYRGPLAVMSFNPHSVARAAELLPDVARGLTTCNYAPDDWPLPKPVRERLREIPDFDAVGASFISHYASDLFRPRVQALRQSGVPVLCWTIKSHAAEREARLLCDNVTFEGYAARIGA